MIKQEVSGDMDKRLIVVIICAVMPLCFVAFIASRQNNKLVQANSQQLLRTKVDEQMELVLLELSQAQSAERGFLLTGKDEMLAPAIAAPAAIEKSFRALNRLLENDPMQTERLNRLEPMVRERLNFIASVVITKKQRGLDSAMRLLADGKADQLSTKVKSLADDILTSDRQLTEDIRLKKDESTEKLKNERLLLLAAFLSVFMIGSNYMFGRLN